MLIHDTMESLYETVGMDVLPDEYLPDDYTCLLYTSDAADE